MTQKRANPMRASGSGRRLAQGRRDHKAARTRAAVVGPAGFEPATNGL